jgi:ATP adenylyltransferase
MERMFAPWRMAYIRSGEVPASDCFICDKFKDKVEHDRKNLVLHRGKLVFSMLNLYPYTNGHVMIAPQRHIAHYEELTDDELFELHKASQKYVKVIKAEMSAQGFNIGFNIGRVSGAGCDGHLHLHIVPRWNGDTNFMPVLSDTKVISEGLTETYNLLMPKIRSVF